MERLDIDTAPQHAGIEAAIHFSRYAIARNLVRGKRVLDVACGEGYGSFLLKQAGARHVTGIDISAETIVKAQETFGSEGISFAAMDAASLAESLGDEPFDVIVSIETIEHVSSPESFLHALRKVASADAAIVITCPNDYWYYPEEGMGNPYHTRKYRMEEFQRMTTSVLGDNVQWAMGTGVFGFGTVPVSPEKKFRSIPKSWMSYLEPAEGYLVNGESVTDVAPSTSSYFVGIWNAPEISWGLAVFPITMDTYATMVNSEEAKSTAGELTEENARLRSRLEDAETVMQKERTEHDTRRVALEEQLEAMQKRNRDLALRHNAVRMENELAREGLEFIRRENESLRIGHDRYIRLRDSVPESVRPTLIRLYQLSQRMRGRG